MLVHRHLLLFIPEVPSRYFVSDTFNTIVEHAGVQGFVYLLLILFPCCPGEVMASPASISECLCKFPNTFAAFCIALHNVSSGVWLNQLWYRITLGCPNESSNITWILAALIHQGGSSLGQCSQTAVRTWAAVASVVKFLASRGKPKLER